MIFSKGMDLKSWAHEAQDLSLEAEKELESHSSLRSPRFRPLSTPFWEYYWSGAQIRAHSRFLYFLIFELHHHHGLWRPSITPSGTPYS